MNLSILIASHSEAFDIWHITDYFFNKYFSDTPYDIYLGANGKDRKEYCPEKWKYINVGDDESWSKSLKSYLIEIESEYILLMLDDFIFLDTVKHKNIEDAYQFLVEQDGVMLRLTPNPKGTIKFNKYFNKVDIKNNVPYATSLQMAIWNKNFLLKLLDYDFNPWEFEIRAGKTVESKENFDRFFVANGALVSYTHFLEKGRFYPMIKDLAIREGVFFDFSKREFLSPDDIHKMRKDNFRATISKIIPHKYKNSIRKLMGYHEL